MGIVCQYLKDSTGEHMEGVIRILMYLKGTPGLDLRFQKHTSGGVEVYTDAS